MDGDLFRPGWPCYRSQNLCVAVNSVDHRVLMFT